MSGDIDDLLTPSLRLEHDVTSSVQPFSPSTILLVTFFTGPFVGWVLTFWNERRTGLRRLPLLIAAGIALFIAWGWSFSYSLQHASSSVADIEPLSARASALEKAEKDAGSTHRLIWRGCGVFALYLLATPQRKRVKIAESRGIDTASIFGPFFIALLIAFAIQIPIIVVLKGIP